MRHELELRLARRWPSWFDLAADPMLCPMSRGFECGDGWFDIAWRLCCDLEPLVMELEKRTGGRFNAMQVKQKLGTLRFYVSHHTDAIDGRIAEAQEASSLTCEICGQPGRTRSGGWIQTLCDEHAEGRGTFTGWEGN